MQKFSDTVKIFNNDEEFEKYIADKDYLRHERIFVGININSYLFLNSIIYT